MDWPRISVIVPSWQSGQFLEAALISVFRQDYPNLELIVVDNVSTDSTTKILEKYCDRFSVLLVEPDRGQSDAINKGIALSSGDILCWLNADDLYLPGCLHRVASEFTKSSPDILFGDTVYIDARGKVIKCALQPPPRRFFCKRGLLPLSAPVIFFSARSWERAGGLDESLRLSMDVDLCCRILVQGGRLGFVRGYGGAFRWHDDSKTSTDLARRGSRENDETKVVLDRYLGSDRRTGMALLLKRLWLLAGLYPLRRKLDFHRHRDRIERYIAGLSGEGMGSASASSDSSHQANDAGTR